MMGSCDLMKPGSRASRSAAAPLMNAFLAASIRPPVAFVPGSAFPRSPISRLPCPPRSRFKPSVGELLEPGPVDLARRGPGKALHHDHVLRPVRTVEPAGQPSLELLLLLLGYHRGAHTLSPPWVRQAEHGRLVDPGVLEQHPLDLRRIDVHASRDDEVLPASCEEEVAVVIEAAEIIHREQVPPPGLPGPLGIVPVLP